MVRVRCALRLCRLSSDHVLFAREAIAGMIYRHQGRVREAVEEFTEAYAARKRAGDYAGIYRSLTNLALTHFASGDMRQAKTVLGDALSYVRKYNGIAEVRMCLFNRFLLELFAGDLLIVD